MAPSELRQRIEAKDWSILGPPFEGPGGRTGLADEIRLLASHADSEIRELALYVLNELGGPIARRALLEALRDPDKSVRARACAFLHGHHDVNDRAALEQELDTNADEYVREHVALIVGELGDAASVAALRERAQREDDEHARWGMTLALARLGDHAALTLVARRLSDDRPSTRVAALRDLPYVGDTRLLAPATDLLDDERDAVNVGLSHAPLYIRVCDVCVNTLDALLGHPFPFDVATRRYTREELMEAARIARARAAAAPSLSRRRR